MFDELSLKLRRMIIDALEGAGRGHVGPSFSLVEILRVLYYDYLNISKELQNSQNRDRVILSKGHGCLALYAILADRGFFTREELLSTGRLGSILGGHPERGLVPGVEASTGALGHGLAFGVGVALAGRLSGCPFRVAVVVGDGELNEGSVWEAALHASKHRVDRLTVFVDHNKAQCYGPSHLVVDMAPLGEKWRSFGFGVEEVDGHDIVALRAAVARLPFTAERPSVLICHTVKGKGLGPVEGSPDWHYRATLSAESAVALRAALTQSIADLVAVQPQHSSESGG